VGDLQHSNLTCPRFRYLKCRDELRQYILNKSHKPGETISEEMKWTPLSNWPCAHSPTWKMYSLLRFVYGCPEGRWVQSKDSMKIIDTVWCQRSDRTNKASWVQFKSGEQVRLGEKLHGLENVWVSTRYLYCNRKQVTVWLSEMIGLDHGSILATPLVPYAQLRLIFESLDFCTLS